MGLEDRGRNFWRRSLFGAVANCWTHCDSYIQLFLPDELGTGDRRSRATGCTRNFRSTDYDDMVAAHHALLEHLGVEHLRLILGTSMGCMHSLCGGKRIRSLWTR